MCILELIRLESSEEGTIGILKLNKDILCFTLEEKYRENQQNKSCIPTGQYSVEPKYSPHFGNVMKVLNVDGRTEILFHKGNTVEDTDGCILLGDRQGFLNGSRAILDSGKAFINFMDLVQNDRDVVLTITENY